MKVLEKRLIAIFDKVISGQIRSVLCDTTDFQDTSVFKSKWNLCIKQETNPIGFNLFHGLLSPRCPVTRGSRRSLNTTSLL
jgi:hypothetical protein